jgi:hypothetical protein
MTAVCGRSVISKETAGTIAVGESRLGTGKFLPIVRISNIGTVSLEL